MGGVPVRLTKIGNTKFLRAVLLTPLFFFCNFHKKKSSQHHFPLRHPSSKGAPARNSLSHLLPHTAGGKSKRQALPPAPQGGREGTGGRAKKAKEKKPEIKYKLTSINKSNAVLRIKNNVRKQASLW